MSSDFYGILRIDALKFQQRVFRSSASDLHQCCVGLADQGVAFECHFSGVDNVIGRGAVSIESDRLTVRWCTALEYRGVVLDKGERNFKVNPSARLRLVAQGPCSPKDPFVPFK
jgi:hypothetical protein